MCPWFLTRGLCPHTQHPRPEAYSAHSQDAVNADSGFQQPLHCLQLGEHQCVACLSAEPERASDFRLYYRLDQLTAAGSRLEGLGMKRILHCYGAMN